MMDHAVEKALSQLRRPRDGRAVHAEAGLFVALYLSNEALSLFENAAHIGLPVPDKLREALAQLHGRSDKDNTTDQDDKGDGE